MSRFSLIKVTGLEEWNGKREREIKRLGDAVSTDRLVEAAIE